MYEWIAVENSVREIDILVEAKNRNELGFAKAKLERVWLLLIFIKKQDLKRVSATSHPITFTNQKLKSKLKNLEKNYYRKNYLRKPRKINYKPINL